MKNEEKIAVAQKIAEYAKKQGFTDAAVRLFDEDGEFYDHLSEIAANYGEDDVVDVTITVFLDDSLRFELVGISEDADAEPEIRFV